MPRSWKVIDEVYWHKKTRLCSVFFFILFSQDPIKATQLNYEKKTRDNVCTSCQEDYVWFNFDENWTRNLQVCLDFLQWKNLNPLIMKILHQIWNSRWNCFREILLLIRDVNASDKNMKIRQFLPIKKKNFLQNSELQKFWPIKMSSSSIWTILKQRLVIVCLLTLRKRIESLFQNCSETTVTSEAREIRPQIQFRHFNEMLLCLSWLITQ